MLEVRSARSSLSAATAASSSDNNASISPVRSNGFAARSIDRLLLRIASIQLDEKCAALAAPQA